MSIIVNSILVYGVIALSTSIFAECSVKVSNKIISFITKVITLLIPSFFAGVRYGIGTDYFSYQEIFEKVKYGYDIRQEIGYKVINYLIYWIGGDIQLVFFVISFFTILFIYLSLYDHKDKISVGFGMFVFMLLYYQYSYNGIRHALAMAISLYSIKYIYKRNLIKFLFFTILSISFHMTAILIFPLYFLYDIIGKKRSLIFSVIFFMIFFIMVLNYEKILLPIIGNISSLEYYEVYLNTKEQYSFGIGILVLNLPYILPGMIFLKDLNVYENNFLLYYSFLILGVLLKFSGYFGSQYVNRIAMNFLIVTVILVPYYIRISKYKQTKILSYLIILFIIANWIYNYIYLGSSETVPYKWIYSCMRNYLI